MEWPPNHPAPCGGWSPTEGRATFLRTGAEHKRTTDQNIPVFDNVTQMPNPACTPECADESPCGEGVPTVLTPQTTPKLSPRPDCAAACGGETEVCGSLEGQTRCNDDPGGAAPYTGTLPCGPWPEPLPVGNVYNNTYVATDKTVDLSVCKMRGFKNGFAYKVWHGADAFTADGCPADDDSYSIAFADCPGDWPNATFCADALGEDGYPVNFRQSCISTPYQGDTSLSRKRFLTASITATDHRGFSFVDEGDWDETINTFTQVVTVDRYSGKATLVSCSSTKRTIRHQYPDGTVLSDTTVSGVDLIPSITDLIASAPNCPSSDTCPYKHYGSYGDWTMGPLVVTTSESEYHSSYGSSDPNPNFILSLDLVLSDAYTDTMLNADVDELLSKIDLYNHTQHPWRTDARLNEGPLVIRNERPSRVSPLDFIGRCKNLDGTPFTDPSVPVRPSLPDGSIVGVPNPAGYGRYFDLYHVRYAFKETSGGERNGFVEVPQEDGQYAPDWSPHATLWTDERHARDFPAGPFVCLGGRELISGGFLNPLCLDKCLHSLRVYEDMLIKSKWAETIMFAKPPHNFKRPCGFYDTTELDGSTLGVGTADCVATPFVGTPRWPDAPCGCDDLSHGITAASNASPIVITTDGPHDYDDGALVNICRVRGNKAANGVRRMRVLTANSFALYDKDSGEPIDGNGDYSGGGTADILDFSSYWNSFWRQGKFLFKAWTFSFRDFVESYRTIWQAHVRDLAIAQKTEAGDPCDPPCPALTGHDPIRFTMDDAELTETGNIIKSGSKWIQSLTVSEHCIGFSACCPAAVYVQPPNQAGAPSCNGQIIEMPTLALDYRYGTMWFGRVEQWMTDPLWKAPGRGYEQRLCSGPAGNEDSGGCGGDFPQRNYEEAVGGVPVGAPALPGDARELGCPEYIDRLNMDPPTPRNQEIAPGISECDAPYSFSLEFHGTLGDPDPDHLIRCADDDPYIDGCCTTSGVTHRYDGYWLYANNGAGPHVQLVENGADDDGPLYTVSLARPWTPWIWLANQEACVRANGSFAAVYKRNGIVL